VATNIGTISCAADNGLVAGHDGPVTDPIPAATERLVTTVDALPDADWGAPSVCVGWSRAHVIAHVALNAEGLGDAVRGLLDGQPTTMYESNERRDEDIAALAAAEPDQIRGRLRTSAACFADAITGLSSLPADATFDRTPGGTVMRAAVVPLLRLREVEIHHADLRAGYTHADWPHETAIRFFERDAGRYDGPPLSAYATDLDRTYPLGAPAEGDPVVSGPVSALAWWLTGRDPGDVLTSSTGALPEMEGR
jgi:maleylpyruvate isomerase